MGLSNMPTLVIATLWGGHPCSCLGKEAPIRGGLGFRADIWGHGFGPLLRFLYEASSSLNRQWWTMSGSWPLGEGA